MNSDGADLALTRLVRELERLEPYQEIEKRAAEVLEHSMAERHSLDFAQFVSFVVSSLRLKAALLPIRPARAVAYREGLVWLDRHYSARDGSNAARLEFSDGVFGYRERIADALLSGFLEGERQLIVDLVFHRCIGCSWDLRVRLTGQILQRYGSWFPLELRNTRPSQLAGNFKGLLSAIVESSSTDRLHGLR